MRIAYVIDYDTDGPSGVLLKARDQIRAWQEAGHKVRLFALSSVEVVWHELLDLPHETVRIAPRSLHWMVKFPLNLLPCQRMVVSVIHWQPDVVYLRSMLYYPPLHRLIVSLPTIVEVNTKEISEKKQRSKLRAFYSYVTRRRLFRNVEGIVAVTGEIAHDVRRFGCPTVTIANGIDLRSRPASAAPSNTSPHLVFIGSGHAQWHGVDKIIPLANHFSNWQFTIIGTSKVDCSLSNVRHHGLLDPVAYSDLLTSSDVALGTLALHRNSMDEASPLKVREYLAYRIPTIIGYRDTDFPNPVPFLLQLPNTPTNVVDSFDRIAQFVAQWKGKRVPREAVAHLDNRNKEKARLAFFEQVLRESR